MRRDLTAFDTLRPRLNRFEKLYERMRDSQLALGSDLMSASLEGYLAFVQAIERDKLYHFVMASEQPNPVLII